MSSFKTIISGRLEFGNAKSFETVAKMYQQRLETFYRTSELLVKGENIFDASSHVLDIPRITLQATEKGLQNTLELLHYLAQFAVAGDIQLWVTDNGKVLRHEVIEPASDKVAVRAYRQGRQLVAEKGRENEAKAALSTAIEKYERHALAYERRGYVNFLLKNHTDAMYDFSKSIDINPNNAAPYFGRAIVKMTLNDLAGAITDLENAIKRSIPLQPIYWKARRVKGECHLRLADYENAVFELKLFTGRVFSREDSNYKWRQFAWFNYGKALLALGKNAEAIQAFDKALEINDASPEVAAADLAQYRDKAAKNLDAKVAA